MNKKDIKNIVQGGMTPFLEQHGYKKSRALADVISNMEKDTGQYSYSFQCSVYSYDVYKLDYSFGFGIVKVVEILRKIHEHTPLRKGNVVIPKLITGISPGLLSTPDDPFLSLKSFGTEEQLFTLLDDVKSFYQNEFKAFCDKYSDVKAMDKQFNSLDQFYEKEHGVFPPLAFLSVTRLIIARLAENPRFEEVVERNFEMVRKEWLKSEAIYDRNDEKMPEVYAVKYLRDLKL